jgi:hypothetical protein
MLGVIGGYMDVALARNLVRLEPETLKTDLARKSLIEVKEVLDLYLTTNWFRTASDILSVPPDRVIAFMVSFSNNETYEPENEITGVDSMNYKEKLIRSIRWLTPMVFSSIISILESFLEGIREIPLKPTNKNVFTRAQEFINNLHPLTPLERETGRRGSITALGILSELKQRRNDFVHRRDKERNPRTTSFTIDDPINAILNGIYIILILDDLIDTAILTQIS